jgi:TonB-linked SusC/RagA family outer membrane protein
VTTNQTGYDRDTRYYVQTNGTLEISVPGVEGLKFTANAAIDRRLQQNKRWNTPWYLYTWDGTSMDPDTGDPLLVRGARGPAEPNLSQGNEDQLNVLLGGVLSYDRSFGDHNLTFLAGTNKETIEFASFGAYRRFFISDAIDQMFAGGDLQKDNNGGAWERARLNYFGRVAYNYKEKYLAEFLWRYDGSYMFPEETRYGFFPGVLAGWVVSEEDFWKNNISFMDFFKIRGSWGQMGNDNITLGPDGPLLEYQFLSTYGFGSYIIGGQEMKTLRELRVPNRNITWEVANNANFGIEGQMLEGRIFFEFDYFINKRTNILWPRFGSVPQSTGMVLPPENIGEVQNRGYDFNVGYNGQIGDLSFNASVNGGYAQNEILFWDEAPGAPAWQQTTGRPMYTYQVYEYDGVFASQEEIDASNIDYSALTKTLRPGDMKYKDLYGPDGVPDGKITPDDMVRTDYTAIPTFQGGVNIGARYKNFDLSILFQGATGARLPVITESGSIGNYLLETYENRWTVDNPSSEHPRIADRNNQWYSTNNTYWLRNSDYVRLKNFEIGYSLPTDLLSRVGISNMRVYTNGLNLFTLDNLDVYDPESGSASGQYYPQSRIINFGATVTF